MIEAPKTHMANDLQLSGLVLAGTSEMMVGLTNSQWLRVPLSAFPDLQQLTGDEWLNYRIAANGTQLRWPGRDIHLSVLDLVNRAISIDDGDEGPR